MIKPEGNFKLEQRSWATNLCQRSEVDALLDLAEKRIQSQFESKLGAGRVTFNRKIVENNIGMNSEGVAFESKDGRVMGFLDCRYTNALPSRDRKQNLGKKRGAR